MSRFNTPKEFSTLLKLPLIVLTNIFIHLSANDLRNLMISCKKLRCIILSDHAVWKKIRDSKFSIFSNGFERCASNISCYNQCRISHNWTNGIYRDKVILQHQTNYLPWICLFSENFYLSIGSELRCYPVDKKGVPISKPLLWKVDVPKVMRRGVRTNDISRFIVKDDNFVCGNRDGCVALFHMDAEQRPSLVDHIRDCHENGTVEISSVDIITSNNELITAISTSKDSQLLKFWKNNNWSKVNMNTLKCYSHRQLAIGETKCIREIFLPECIGGKCISLSSDQRRLAIGPDGNNLAYLLDVETGQLALNKNISLHINQAIRDICWLDRNIVTYVTHSGFLYCADIRNSEVIYYNSDPFQCSLYCVRTDGHNAIVVGSSNYSRCVLFDIRQQTRHVQMYFTQKRSSPVYSLDFNSSKLIAAADRSISVLDFNVRVGTTQNRDYSHPFEVVS